LLSGAPAAPAFGVSGALGTGSRLAHQDDTSVASLDRFCRASAAPPISCAAAGARVRVRPTRRPRARDSHAADAQHLRELALQRERVCMRQTPSTCARTLCRRSTLEEGGRACLGGCILGGIACQLGCLQPSSLRVSRAQSYICKLDF